MFITYTTVIKLHHEEKKISHCFMTGYTTIAGFSSHSRLDGHQQNHICKYKSKCITQRCTGNQAIAVKK